MNSLLKLLFLLLGGMSLAQTPITLEEAHQKALDNNMNLKTGQLRIDFQEKIKQTATGIDPLTITGEVGQLNSIYVDHAFSVNQSLRLPKFYQKQKEMLMEEWKNAVLNLNLQKWQLKKEIALVYNQLNYLDEKEKLLKKADSLYSAYYQKAVLRLKAGESNILEKTTAENYRSQAEIQINNLQQDREIAIRQFNFLINDTNVYTNMKSDFYAPLAIEAPIPSEQSVFMQSLEQQRHTEKAKLEAEKTKLLPTLSFGLSSGTQYGIGADDRFYNHSRRFQSGMVGIGLPVFNRAQKAAIEGQKINQMIAENNYQLGWLNLKNQYAKAYGNYLKLKNETEYYQKQGEANAKTIMFTANLLLKEGETNYLEYSILVNQALDLMNRHIDAQKALNDSLIELQSLSEN
ncbi:TolC family protein [Bergeyella sp. RCAD1439]|uniref:TolC family protein n=1 Tax=Bergeyella anatis TaxID=3113737 RepID=UPI002E18F56E|nr:TolC family protein [Bergeyella sp. RCAD1439]